jgi:hypothetical protein
MGKTIYNKMQEKKIALKNPHPRMIYHPNGLACASSGRSFFVRPATSA